MIPSKELGTASRTVTAIVHKMSSIEYAIHSCAYTELTQNLSIMICFVFPYLFGAIVLFMTEFLGSPHWTPVCMWYGFLIHTFWVDTSRYSGGPQKKSNFLESFFEVYRIVLNFLSTIASRQKLVERLRSIGEKTNVTGISVERGNTTGSGLENGESSGVGSGGGLESGKLLIIILRCLLPLFFFLEGFTQNCIALNLDGSELLIVSCILSAVKNGWFFHPIFMATLSAQILFCSTLESPSLIEMYLVQYAQILLSLNTFYLIDNVL